MERLVLKNNYLEAVICPEVGASIEAFRYSLKGRWVVESPVFYRKRRFFSFPRFT